MCMVTPKGSTWGHAQAVSAFAFPVPANSIAGAAPATSAAVVSFFQIFMVCSCWMVAARVEPRSWIGATNRSGSDTFLGMQLAL